MLPEPWIEGVLVVHGLEMGIELHAVWLMYSGALLPPENVVRQGENRRVSDLHGHRFWETESIREDEAESPLFAHQRPHSTERKGQI